MKRFNINEFIWFIILLAFTYYTYDLIYTNNIYKFIHPKMIKYTFFSLVVFFVLTIFQIKSIFTINHTRRIKLGYIIFIIPLVLGFTIEPKEIDSNVAAKKGLILNKKIDKKAFKAQINKESIQNVDIIEENRIEFTDENFSYMLDDVCTNIEDYKGKKIIISGFVFKENSFKENEFVVSRMLMSCCAADTQLVGLLSKWDEAKNLSNDQWIKVVGTIEETNYKDETTEEEGIIPYIRVENVEILETPVKQYIYPFDM